MRNNYTNKIRSLPRISSLQFPLFVITCEVGNFRQTSHSLSLSPSHTLSLSSLISPETGTVMNSGVLTSTDRRQHLRLVPTQCGGTLNQGEKFSATRLQCVALSTKHLITLMSDLCK